MHLVRHFGRIVLCAAITGPVGLWSSTTASTGTNITTQDTSNNDYASGNGASAGPYPGYSDSSCSAIGIGATAEGEYNTAVGAQAKAVGTGGWPGYETALGYNADAAQYDSTALGALSYANINAVSVGESATAAVAGVAVGYDASAASNSTALGWGANASGMQSVAIGQSSQAGADAIAVGAGATANYQEALAVGVASKAEGDYSAVYGYEATAVDFGTSVGSSSSAADGASALGACRSRVA